MNDLLAKLEEAINERARVIEGSGYLGWLTFRFADGSMHYTAAAGSQPLDEPHWMVDGKEATGYTRARIVYDEKRERRRVARDRKLLELHRPTLEIVEWPHALDERGKNWTCPSCHPANPTDPTEWRPPIGAAHLLPEGFVPNYVLAPCPTLAALTEDYEIEVSDHV